MITLLLAAALALESPAPVPDPSPEEEGLRQLVQIRRVYVERLAGGETSAQMRDMIISSLQNTRLFVITENQDRADAILRGSSEDLVFTDVHTSSDSLNAHANVGNSRSSQQRGTYAGMSAGESESS